MWICKILERTAFDGRHFHKIKIKLSAKVSFISFVLKSRFGSHSKMKNESDLRFRKLNRNADSWRKPSGAMDRKNCSEVTTCHLILKGLGSIVFYHNTRVITFRVYIISGSMENQLWLSVLLIDSTEQDSKASWSPQTALCHRPVPGVMRKMFLKSLVQRLKRFLCYDTNNLSFIDFQGWFSVLTGAGMKEEAQIKPGQVVTSAFLLATAAFLSNGVSLSMCRDMFTVFG